MKPGRADTNSPDKSWRCRDGSSGQTLRELKVLADLYPKRIANSYGIFELMVKRNDKTTVVYI